MRAHLYTKKSLFVKFFQFLFLPLLISFLWMGNHLKAQNCSDSGLTSSGHEVTFNGVTYQSGQNGCTSTWNYCITANLSTDISHILFGNSSCSDCLNETEDVTEASHSFTMGSDPGNAACGINFGETILAGQTTCFSFTLNGAYEKGEIEFLASDQSGFSSVPVCGPICTAPSCDDGEACTVDVFDYTTCSCSNEVDFFTAPDVTDVLCGGESTGTVEVLISGGTPPYSFVWNNGETTPSLTNVPAGIYIATVTDANGCTNSCNAQVVEGPQLVATCTPQGVSCPGNNDGSITLNAGGGTAPYSFEWSNGATTQNLANIDIGNYTVTVTDQNGCTVTCSTEVGEDNPFIATCNITDINCLDPNSGYINLDVFGGNGSYTYTWSNGATTEDITNLSAGTYEVTVIDAIGCTATCSAVLENPVQITLTCIADPIDCNVPNSGSIDLTVNGGNGNFSYLWSNGATTEDVFDLSAGTYEVTVSDSNGCTATAVSVVEEAPVVTATCVASTVNCLNPNSGSINVTVNSGTAPYIFIWSNGSITEDIENLEAGDYTLTIVDSNGCSTTCTSTVEAAPDLEISCIANPVNCAGSNSGSVEVTVSGGVSPFSYEWSNGATTEDISGLAIGTYSLTVTDANGCTTTCSNLVEEIELIASCAPGSVNCTEENTGSIDLTVDGGTEPYVYLWNNGTTTEDLENVPSGIYEVTVSDANGCTATCFSSITDYSPLTASSSSTDVICSDANSGAIDLTVTGGFGNYTYEWSNGATSEDLAGITGGEYIVTITDEQNCFIEHTTVVIDTLLLVVNCTGTEVECTNPNTGTAEVSVTGGSGIYTYQWSTGATTSSISDLPVGSYTVAVTDSEGCFAICSATVSPSSGLSADCTPEDTTCDDPNSGGVDTDVEGGTGDYTYEWNTGDTTANLTGVPQGIYEVTISDSEGCSTVCTTSVGAPAGVSLTCTPTSVSCVDMNSGSVDLTVNGGEAPFTFAWSNGAVTEDISGLGLGVYTVTVTDSLGCSSTCSATVGLPGVLTASCIPTNEDCNTPNTGSVDLTVSGGLEPYTFEWSTGHITEDISGLAPGSYGVTIIDANGCFTSCSTIISNPDIITATCEATNITTCSSPNSAAIALEVMGGSGNFTYAWSNGATTQNINNIPVGTYEVTITDTNGCFTTCSSTVSSPDEVFVECIPQNLDCLDPNSGAVSLIVTGGSGSYTYNWSNGATTESISSLPLGTYSVTVTDSNDCMVSCEAIIGEAVPLSLNCDPQAANCGIANSGSVDLTVNGGTGNYTYEWSNGATTEDIENLNTGNYSVTVYDANGCSETCQATVGENTPILLSCVSTRVSCDDNFSGAVDVMVSGGSGNYSYNWSNGATSEDIDGLAAGTYTVTITDSDGCSTTCTSIVQSAEALLATASTNNVICPGEAFGTINVEVLNGTPPYTFIWSNGSTDQNLSAGPGTYFVIIKDANNCSGFAQGTITQPAFPLSSFTSPTDVNCMNPNSGAVDLTVTGGTAPYSFEWSNGATSEDLSGLSVGTYLVTITDASGCTVANVSSIIQSEPFNIFTYSNHIQCGGDSTGSAGFVLEGGTAPFTYEWSNGATGETLENVAAGVYHVTATDANGCIAVCHAIIKAPSEIDLTCLATDGNCSGKSSGSIDLVINGGNAPFEYIWSNGSTASNLTNLPPGDYSVTVTDETGCSAVCSTSIQNIESDLAVECSATSIYCNPKATGTASVSATGGTAPYSYLWSNGANTASVSGLSAGEYSVTVMDANGCNQSCDVIVDFIPNSLVVTCSSTDLYCGSVDSGTANVNVSGGIAPYTYSWSNGANTPSLTNLTAGTYDVTVTDANGCMAFCNTTILEIENTLDVICQSTDLFCGSTNTGTAEAIVSGGIAPFTYQWSNGETTATIDNLEEGIYGLTVTDANGCFATCSTAVTEFVNNLSASCSATNIFCGAMNTGTVASTISGGTAPYSYLWSNGATTTSQNGLNAGYYELTVTDGNGCSVICGTTIIEVEDNLEVTCSSTNLYCGASNMGTVAATVTGGVAPLTYQWSNGANTPTQSDLGSGTYDLTVTDGNGCMAFCSTTVTEVVNTLEVTCSSEDLYCGETNAGIATASVSGGVAPLTYQWSNGATTTSIDGLAAGTYELTVTDSNGCVAICSTTISEVVNTLEVECTSTNINCGETNTGTVNSTVTGGVAPFTYLWDNGSTSPALDGLGSGVYNLTVTDANGCVATCSTIINEIDSNLEVSCTSNDLYCGETNTGFVASEVTGGISPYVYQWSNGVNTASQDGLEAGTYNLTVTDANGCNAVCSTTILAIENTLTISCSATDIICAGHMDGTAQVAVNGGVAPYHYLWSNGSSTETINNLTAGSYGVTVTDANGCFTSCEVEVNQPETLSAEAQKENPGCENPQNGSITVAATGGTPPFSYSIDNGQNFQSSNVFENLSSGEHTILVTDSHDCFTSLVINLIDDECIEYCTVTADYWGNHLEEVQELIEEFTECIDTFIPPCLAIGADGAGHAMWFNDYEFDPHGNNANFQFGDILGTLVENETDGTAELHGEVFNVNNPDDSWVIDLYLSDRMNWDEWSALGRSYKDENNHAGDNYVDWNYYIMSLDQPSTLTGTGINEGIVYTLSHNPANYNYGFQVGLGANSKNPNYGLSGWFSRTLDGANFVNGDFNLDLYCEPGEDHNNACVSTTIVEWDLDDCTSYYSNGTNGNYEEFTPTYPSYNGALSVEASNIFRDQGTHSCTPPREESNGEAMCISTKNSCEFQDDDPYALRFTLTMNSTQPEQISALRFWEKAPTEFDWIDGASGPNNYPTFYGIRILKNGFEVYKEVDIPATQNWTEEVFDLSDNPDFLVDGYAYYEVELRGYCRIENGADVSVWDVDDFSIEVCGSNDINDPEPPAAATDCCEEIGKPYQLTLLYSGGDCASSNHNQSGNAFYCNGDANQTEQVYIIANNNSNPSQGLIWYNGLVNLGTTFTLDPSLIGENNLKPNVYIHIYDENGDWLQQIKFHTSCSEPFAVGDIFGSVKVVSYVTKNGATCSETVSNSSENAQCDSPGPDNRCTPPNSFEYISIANGSWNNPSTWQNGNVPSAEQISGNVKITHHVIVENQNIKLFSGKTLYVKDGTLIIENGNLELLDGTGETAIFENAVLRTSGNIDQKANTTICMTDCLVEVGEERASIDFVPGNHGTSANFKNGGGFRRLENVCINVTHDYQNLGEDILIGVCMDVGDEGDIDGPEGINGGYDGQDSGNFQNESGSGISMEIWNSQFYIANGNVQNSSYLSVCNVDFRLTNGNFQVQSGAELTGSDLTIWINHPDNGDIQNSGNWNAAIVSDWRIDNGHSPQGVNLTSPSEASVLSDSFVNCCEASSTGGNSDPEPPVVDSSCCDEIGKPKKLTLRYTGGDCNASAHNQSVAECNGDPLHSPTVYILANDQQTPSGGKIWFEGLVNLNDDFLLDPDNIGENNIRPNVFVHIFTPQGSWLQTVKFHISCSEPFAPGDVYGGVKVVSWIGNNGAECTGNETEPDPPVTEPESIDSLNCTEWAGIEIAEYSFDTTCVGIILNTGTQIDTLPCGVSTEVDAELLVQTIAMNLNLLTNPGLEDLLIAQIACYSDDLTPYADMTVLELFNEASACLVNCPDAVAYTLALDAITNIFSNCTNVVLCTNGSGMVFNTFGDNVGQGDKDSETSSSTFGHQVQLRPNPVDDRLNLMFSVENDIPVIISIQNMNGQLILADQQQAVRGTNKVQFNTQNLSPGAYMISIISDKDIITKQFIKM